MEYYAASRSVATSSSGTNRFVGIPAVLNCTVPHGNCKTLAGFATGKQYCADSTAQSGAFLADFADTVSKSFVFRASVYRICYRWSTGRKRQHRNPEQKCCEPSARKAFFPHRQPVAPAHSCSADRADADAQGRRSVVGQVFSTGYA